MSFGEGSAGVWSARGGSSRRSSTPAKLHPGGFFPFVREPVVSFTDRRVPLGEVFDVDVRALEERLLGAADEVSMALELEALLRAQGALPDDNVELVREVIAEITADSTITKVAQLGRQPRALQRLFRRYVGVSPKWVIRRSRLQSAAEALGASAEVDLVELAAQLGYADQAHFVRDFRTLVGTTPGAYVRRNLGVVGVVGSSERRDRLARGGPRARSLSSCGRSAQVGAQALAPS